MPVAASAQLGELLSASGRAYGAAWHPGNTDSASLDGRWFHVLWLSIGFLSFSMARVQPQLVET